jgi:phosphatidylserine/phosphatidylglycerophosphate/cardiolipin synthase-like enzyme
VNTARDASARDEPDPGTWLLAPAPDGPGDACGIWGAGTDMAARAIPWDAGCSVTPLIGGFDTMNAIRTALERALREAQASSAPPGRRGHVYLAGWRLDPLRDLAGDARVHGWTTAQTVATDATVIGLVLRLLDAGVTVRILLWYPHARQLGIALTKEIAAEHFYLLALVREKSRDLEAKGFPAGLGVVALDTRVGAFAGSHHQKTIVVRGAGTTHVAYCGGVDLAYTRRDAPAAPYDGPPAIHDGDWQSGASLPGGEAPAFACGEWPKQPGLDYPSVCADVVPNRRTITTDLPYDAYGRTHQLWHDQHLELEGDVVVTLEQQFRERWSDPAPAGYARVAPAKPGAGLARNAVYVSHDCVLAGEGRVTVLAELPPPAPLPTPARGGTSLVQMWRTVPVRDRGRASELFVRGEFSNLAGIARACSAASELVWIFEQYLWSRPFCRLLNAALTDAARPGLHVIIVLPPVPDGQEASTTAARRRAFVDLTNGLTVAQLARLRVYAMWHPALARGIYVHAKAQTYDGALLVCGSCNLNQRSFLCDTELNCAVLDSGVVRAHQVNLWRLLFPRKPGLDEQLGATFDLSTVGSGQRFFDAFTRSAGAASFLVEEPHFAQIRDPSAEPALPPGWPARTFNPLKPRLPGFLLDPSSLSTAFPSHGSAAADLLEIARHLTEDSFSHPRRRR